MISQHTFMFPFQWDYIASDKGKENLPYNQRSNIKDFDKIFSQYNTLKRVQYVIDNSALKYNEYTYFHPFVRKALYHMSDKDPMYYYELDEPTGVFTIEYFDGNEKHILNLKLDSICMHIYDTGVGVISYNVINNQYNNDSDILAINEFGRRIYPQYMCENDRLSAKKSFLSNKISGEIGHIKFSEDFMQYSERIESNNVFLPPDHIKKIFGYSDLSQLGDLDLDFVFRSCDEKKEKSASVLW